MTERVLERESRRLDRRLDTLRQAVEAKRHNVQDLSQVLQNDFDGMNKIPKYIWIMMILHGFLACHMYQASQAPKWLFNVICFIWLHRRLYRNIHAWVPILSVFVLLWSAVGTPPPPPQ